MPSEQAPAKINLFLHVVGRRDDGYHLLDSLVVFAQAADRVSAVNAPGLTLELLGPAASLLREDLAENLVLRAAGLLAADRALGARLVLDKILPVASGIGGGSADAAATLRLLARLWGLADADLAGIAPRLGADVPACLASAPARMAGIGEILAAAPALPCCGLVLANPGVAVSTPAVFRARAGKFSAPAALPPRWPDADAMARDLAGLRNDLQAPAEALCPAIRDTLDALARLPGCLLARMSGSGATCFGLFADPPTARAARAGWVAPPSWWIWAGGLHGHD